jgi:ATP-dependent DNA ligase
MNALGVRDNDHLATLLRDPCYIAQEKLDGMRAVVHITPNGLRIFSRSAGVNDPTRPLEKTSSLPHLADICFPFHTGSVLDCEILATGFDSAQLAGSVHKKNGSNHLVKLYVFDILRYCNSDLQDKSLAVRLEWLKRFKREISSEHIYFLPYATTEIDKQRLYNEVIASGREGIMLKRLDALYNPAARPANNWYKAKRSATFDCIVIGFTKGAGKYNNHIGAVRFGQFVDNKLVELGQASGMSDEVRTDMSV